MAQSEQMTVSDPHPSGFSLIFPPGMRPDADAIARLLQTSQAAAQAFAITHQPDPQEGWIELLSHGLTFDLLGLVPAAGAPAPPVAHSYGFAPASDLPEGEVLLLRPGAHLSGGHHLLPVVRAEAAIVLALLALPGVSAIGWGPARTLLAPEYFRRAMGAWLAGGAFPALGFTALLRGPNGSTQSEGLSFFIGKELRIAPNAASDPAAVAKIALRLIHSLVNGFSIESPVEIPGPEGERLGAEPSDNGRILRVWRIQ